MFRFWKRKPSHVELFHKHLQVLHEQAAHERALMSSGESESTESDLAYLANLRDALRDVPGPWTIKMDDTGQEHELRYNGDPNSRIELPRDQSEPLYGVIKAWPIPYGVCASCEGLCPVDHYLCLGCRECAN